MPCTNNNNRIKYSEMSRQTSAKQPNAQTRVNKQTDGRKCRQPLDAKATEVVYVTVTLYIQPTNLARI